VPTNLSPKSQTSAIILTSTGSAEEVASAVPFGMYTGSAAFRSGASDQVAYVYKKLGGDVVDIELRRPMFMQRMKSCFRIFIYFQSSSR
jgi:hypothetical protein